MLHLPEQCLSLPLKAGALCALPVLQMPYLKYLTAGVALPGPPFSILPNLPRSLQEQEGMDQLLKLLCKHLLTCPDAFPRPHS